MKRVSGLFLLAVGATLLAAPLAFSQEPTTFAQAKEMAAQKHKLLLLEFYRDD